MLNQKKLLAKLMMKESAVITPVVGTSYSSYGGCYYETVGEIIHVHIGLSGLTANTNLTVANLPNGMRPSTGIISIGRGSSTNTLCYGSIDANGDITIQSTGAYAMIDFIFIRSI